MDVVRICYRAIWRDMPIVIMQHCFGNAIAIVIRNVRLLIPTNKLLRNRPAWLRGRLLVCFRNRC